MAFDFNFQRIKKTLGPGILFASTAIGVSHLVQSTRAGANYGLALVGLVLLTNLMKYPFFEFGSRYANVKGKSIIDGYKDLGQGVLWMYILITLASMFFVTAAVAVVTAGFFNNLFHIDDLIDNSLLWVVIFVLMLCSGILFFGRYKVLDNMIKVIGSLLLISTLFAFVLTLFHGPTTSGSLMPQLEWNETDILFLIALMGWMPTAVDLSAWNSLWTVERIKSTGFKPSLKETLFDFNFGYVVSAVLSLCFITLGAYLVYGTGTALSGKSHVFANQVVSLYTTAIGDWSLIIIGAASFSIMFGTCIAVIDGYARSLGKCVELVQRKETRTAVWYNRSLAVLVLGSMAIIYLTLFALEDEGKGFKKLIDLATTISFLIAPAIAIVNTILVNNRSFPKESRPGKGMMLISVLGIVFLLCFSVLYLIYPYII